MKEDKLSDKSDILKQKMRREYRNILKQELDDVFDHEERLELLNQYIPILYKDLRDNKLKSQRLVILEDLVKAMKQKIELTLDMDERKQLYNDLRELLTKEMS